MSRPRVPRVSEKVVQQQIVTLLRSMGAAVYVLGTRRRRGDFPGTMQTPGVPDLLAFLRVVSGGQQQVWIEVKAQGGQLRPEQVGFAQSCAEAAVPHIVGDLDAVTAWLLQHGYLKATNVPHYRQPVEARA